MTSPVDGEPVPVEDFEIRREAMRLALTHGGWTDGVIGRAKRIERYLRGTSKEDD